MSQQKFTGLDDQTQSQLKILGEIADIFSSLHGRFWLRGGWAIDFLLGRITRTHEDIDLVTWKRHQGRLEQSLVEAGFEHIPVSKRQSDFRKGEVDIQFLYLTRGINGHIIPHDLPEWVWRPDALPSQRFELCGISACVLSPHQLLEEKVVYEQIGRTARPKDLESKNLLQSIISTRSVGQRRP
ncbi:nucleotidyltransferase domain-containing protein [Paenibacillus sp. MBLB4367]|uniref:nucleotidyl transferase AbiEii/AbiGii toxin family protein n=1 Tax=Paenibacillus sp. MBLB4367 TaxID=3384767 RepID=UPI003908414E